MIESLVCVVSWLVGWECGGAGGGEEEVTSFICAMVSCIAGVVIKYQWGNEWAGED